ncbi:MAG: cupin domain-containing protein [Candidatus Shapirobacteria bacterium]
MKLIKSDEKKWLEKQGYSKKIYLNENDLNRKGELVQKIKIKPGEIAESHYHKKQTEIFYFLNNNGYYIINDKKVFVKPEDVLVVEPGDKHVTINNTDKDFLYMVFKFNYDEKDIFWD